MSKMWFRAKRYGLGAGLPIAWEGWALLAAYVAALVILIWLSESLVGGLKGALIQGGGTIALSILLLIIVHGRTEGGWRWRWGNDD